MLNRDTGPTVEAKKFSISYPSLAVAGVVLAGLLVLVVSRLDRGSRAPLVPPGPVAGPAAAADDSVRWFRGKPGPWGELEYVRINIERPDEYVAVDTGPLSDTVWQFIGMKESQVLELFAAAPLTPAQRTHLAEKSRWQSLTNGIAVTPGSEVILGLSPPARQKIYGVLAQFPVNSFQHVPFTSRADEFEEWFARSGLSPATLALAKRLVYQRGDSLCFSDLPEIFSATPSLEERRRLLKTLSRHTSVLMKLRVRPDSNIEALVGYWGRAGRAKDIRPLLESLTKVPGGTTLDIAHLMSPFSRARLYTFPLAGNDPDASHRDCFWTTMNFFNERPDDRYFDFENTRKTIAGNYSPVVGQPTYGDIIFVHNALGTIVHAAIYIADDVVFTKNGAHFNQPWILMRMDDMMAAYPAETPYKLAVYRLKSS
jgi:hypothetical protein